MLLTTGVAGRCRMRALIAWHVHRRTRLLGRASARARRPARAMDLLSRTARSLDAPRAACADSRFFVVRPALRAAASRHLATGHGPSGRRV